MKVLHLIGGGDRGGAKTHVLSLLQELNKTGSAVLAYAALTAVSGLGLAWFGLKKKEN